MSAGLNVLHVASDRSADRVPHRPKYISGLILTTPPLRLALNPQHLKKPALASLTLTMTIPTPLQEALRDSITSGTFVDTKFWVFSKRGSKPGRIVGPKALFVNERVAKRVPRLGAREVFPPSSS